MLINYRVVAEEILAKITKHDSHTAQVDALSRELEWAEENGWKTALKHVGEQLRELGL